jgi:hypothetical protein
MRERDMPQAFHRHHCLDRLPHEREGPAQACIEKERLLVQDQILVEAEPTGYDTDRGADPVDPLGDILCYWAGRVTSEQGLTLPQERFLAMLPECTYLTSAGRPTMLPLSAPSVPLRRSSIAARKRSFIGAWRRESGFTGDAICAIRKRPQIWRNRCC